MLNKVKPVWPNVPLISKPIAFASRGERLAGARSGPDWHFIRYAGAPQREAPNPNTCEKVALGVSADVEWVDIEDAPFINIALGNFFCFDKLPQDCSREWVELIVICSPNHF